VNTGIDIC